MAEGGKNQRSFSDSLSKASGDADESFCDPCKTEGKWLAVEGYCNICKEYLCDNCLSVHKKQTITRAHVILDKKQMPAREGSATNQDLCTEVCQTHHPKIIRFYCKAHDEPGCGDCMTLKHTSCKKDRVQDISKGFKQTKEFKAIDQKLQQFHQEIEIMADVLDNNLENLDATYNNVLQKIESVREQINVFLDQMEKEITDEAAQMKKRDEIELETLIAENESMKSELEDIVQRIKNDSDVNENSVFVITKQAQKRLSTMKSDITRIKQSQEQEYEFLSSNEIERIVSAKTPLGTLTRRSQQNSWKRKKKQRSSVLNTEATYKGNINVKIPTDKNDCFIKGCTLLSPDRMVVIDSDNTKVKLIDINNNSVISSHSTFNNPRRVTAMRSDLIAVTLSCKIKLLKVTTTFINQVEINLTGDCLGLAYSEGKFAVSYTHPGRVEILDIQGIVLHTIQPKQGKAYFLKMPNYILFGQDNGSVIVSDISTHTVSVVTFSGQILGRYTHDKLNNPQGIGLTADGDLYVCSWGNSCIHVVSPDFKTSKIIINEDKNVVNPGCITYCDINHRLYISNYVLARGVINNTIHVYDLKVQV